MTGVSVRNHSLTMPGIVFGSMQYYYTLMILNAKIAGGVDQLGSVPRAANHDYTVRCMVTVSTTLHLTDRQYGHVIVHDEVITW